MTSPPKTVIDLLEVPFTPTTTRDGFLDVGTPSSNNGGCIRFVLPPDAGIISSTTSLWLEHAIGVVTDSGVRRPGSMTLCLATSAGYLYRIVFQHHPSDVVVSTREEMLYGGGGGGFLRSCLGRSMPMLHGPWTLGDANVGGATMANVAQARWVDSFTLLLFGENGSSAIVKVCDPNDDDDDDDDDDDMIVKSLTCLAPAPESGGISSLISWISGKSSSQCSQSTRSSVEQRMTPLDTWRTVNQSSSSASSSSSSSSSSSAAATASHGGSSTRRREHLAGTIIETGIGLVVIVVVREENDKCGLEVWCNMEDNEGKDTWLRTCVVNGDEMGASFVAFCRRTTVMTSCLRIEACAYGKNRSLVSVVIAVPEGGEQQDNNTTTRLLRLEGVLRSSDDSADLHSTLSLLLPEKSVAANGTSSSFHVLMDDQVDERGQINFDSSSSSSSRVVDMQLSIMDINEDALDEEAIPSLDVLLEVRGVDDEEEEEETCMLHFDRYDGTIPRVEKTLVTSQPCCLSRRNLLLFDFNFLMEDGGVEGEERDEEKDEGGKERDEGSEERGEERGESGEMPPMTADDVEEHLMRRVMIPSRYTTTTLKYAVTQMSTSTNERKGTYK